MRSPLEKHPPARRERDDEPEPTFLDSPVLLALLVTSAILAGIALMSNGDAVTAALVRPPAVGLEPPVLVDPPADH